MQGREQARLSCWQNVGYKKLAKTQVWPKVSVAVITYNQAKFLRECIESILAQDYPNLEIVVADDASADGTREMLRQYERQYPGLFKLILAEARGGIAVNANRALSACTGEYIALTAGDDLMLPGRIRKQVLALEQNKHLALCSTAVDVFDSETNKTITIGYSIGKGVCEYGPREVVRSASRVYASSVMVRRSMCPKRGFETRIPIGAEWLFWVETLINGRAIALDDVLSRYRHHGANISLLDPEGIASDAYTTMQILEHEYPFLIREVIEARAKLNFSRGVQYLVRGDYKAAADLFKGSFLYKKRVKTFAWIFILSLPNKIRNYLVRWWLRKTGAEPA